MYGNLHSPCMQEMYLRQSTSRELKLVSNYNSGKISARIEHPFKCNYDLVPLVYMAEG